MYVRYLITMASLVTWLTLEYYMLWNHKKVLSRQIGTFPSIDRISRSIFIVLKCVIYVLLDSWHIFAFASIVFKRKYAAIKSLRFLYTYVTQDIYYCNTKGPSTEFACRQNYLTYVNVILPDILLPRNKWCLCFRLSASLISYKLCNMCNFTCKVHWNFVTDEATELPLRI